MNRSLMQVFCALALPAFLIMGCKNSKPDAAPPAETKTESSATAKVLENALFLCYSGSACLGTETRETTQSNDSISVHDVSVLKLNRYGNSVSAEVQHTETLDETGALKHFSTRLLMGGAPMRYDGTAQKNNQNQLVLPVTVSTQGMNQTQILQIPLSEICPQISGGYAVETELLLRPIRVGEKRSLYRINPTMLHWEHVTIECVRIEDIILYNQKTFPLYRLQTSAALLENETLKETPSQEETLWCDGEGRIWKRVSPLMNLASWRVSSEELASYEKSGTFPNAPTLSNSNVNQESSQNPLDFMENQNVSVTFEPSVSEKASLPNALEDAEKITYKISAIQSNENVQAKISNLFTSSEFQSVEPQSDTEVRIVVQNSKAELSSTEGGAKTTDEDLAASPLIQSDAPAVRTLASSIVPGENDPKKVADALENFVFRYIKNKNYARGFVTALEVVENPSGDCTEHAVLLAALARSRNIPARIAQGMIYVPYSKKMVWHVWNELFVDGHWIPYDATIGRGAVAPNHLRINAGSFSGTTLAATLLPAAQLIGKIEITVEDVQ